MSKINLLITMLNEKLSAQLSQSILEQKMPLENLLGFLKNYPDIVNFLNQNYFKIPLIFNDSPLGKHVVAFANEPDFGLVNKQLSNKQEHVILEIPCVHYLIFQFKEHRQLLGQYFKLEPFKLSYLIKENKKYSLFGFNLYNLLGLKIEDANFDTLPLTLSNKDEFFNFFTEKKNNNNYMSIYCDSLFPLFDFKLTIEDLLFENDKLTLEGRDVTFILPNRKVFCMFKNLNELSHHERIPLDNLLQYKIEKEEIDFDFNPSAFFDLLVMKNYFLKNTRNYQFCLTLLDKNPDLFTSDIMALLCLKNFELHEALIQKFPTNYYFMRNQEEQITPSMKKTMINYHSITEEIQSIVDQLATSDEIVNQSWYNLKIHLDTIVQDNGLSFLSDNIEERITFENIISKYIPSIFNNYLSIPIHLRNKENSPFVSMTLTQFSNIEKELEKIELAIIEEDIKKMKVFGKFLDNRLGNNTPDIISIR